MPPRGSDAPSKVGPSTARRATAEERKDSERREKIPSLLNIAPSMFVPLQEDILKKPASEEVLRDRVKRLERILESIDYQREGVKENLLWMFEREKRRVIEESLE